MQSLLGSRGVPPHRPQLGHPSLHDLLSQESPRSQTPGSAQLSLHRPPLRDAQGLDSHQAPGRCPLPAAPHFSQDTR